MFYYFLTSFFDHYIYLRFYFCYNYYPDMKVKSFFFLTREIWGILLFRTSLYMVLKIIWETLCSFVLWNMYSVLEWPCQRKVFILILFSCDVDIISWCVILRLIIYCVFFYFCCNNLSHDICICVYNIQDLCLA